MHVLFSKTQQIDFDGQSKSFDINRYEVFWQGFSLTHFGFSDTLYRQGRVSRNISVNSVLTFNAEYEDGKHLIVFLHLNPVRGLQQTTTVLQSMLRTKSPYPLILEQVGPGEMSTRDSGSTETCCQLQTVLWDISCLTALP